jgi:multidrug transporter EmrE-like cation transporter
MKLLLIALASICTSVLAQFLLKAGMSSDGVRQALAGTSRLGTALAIVGSPLVIGGFVLYALGAVLWLAVLAKWDVSKAYPLVGLGFVLSLGIGWLSGESVSAMRVLGVALIATGVWVVSRT